MWNRKFQRGQFDVRSGVEPAIRPAVRPGPTHQAHLLAFGINQQDFANANQTAIFLRLYLWSSEEVDGESSSTTTCGSPSSCLRPFPGAATLSKQTLTSGRRTVRSAVRAARSEP
ncbi:MAG TPA: hypothetical protein VF592_08740 [Sphingomonas sp.]|jgi:hypothetical protein|uniref:hypothetical protein n=1 Tax=Sphingomonas sp. TaxID=28214 RepID=UPI002ED80D2C